MSALPAMSVIAELDALLDSLSELADTAAKPDVRAETALT
jgi:hypothetical protein